MRDAGSEVTENFCATGRFFGEGRMREGAGEERQLAALQSSEGGVANEGMLSAAREKIEHHAFGGFGAKFAEGKHDLELDIGARVLRKGNEFLSKRVIAIDDA